MLKAFGNGPEHDKYSGYLYERGEQEKLTC